MGTLGLYNGRSQFLNSCVSHKGGFLVRPHRDIADFSVTNGHIHNQVTAETLGTTGINSIFILSLGLL